MRSRETTRFLLDSYVLPVIGRLPIGAISAADVERVLTAMTSRGLATATRRRALSVVRLVLDYGVRDRRLTANVARVIPLPRGSTKREPHWLRADKLGHLADAMPPPRRPVLLFLGLSGLRVHRAVPQSSRTSAAVIGSTKTHQARTVPARAAVIGHVIALRAEAGPGDWLFPTPGRRIWTNTNFRYPAM